MKRVLLLFLWFFALTATGQNVIEGLIRGHADQKVYLMSIYGERVKAIDSLIADQQGRVRFTLVNRLPGMYRLQWGKEAFTDLIWNQENVVFETSQVNPDDSLIIISSAENKFNRNFLALDRLSQAKLQVLMPVIDLYPEKDAFFAGAAFEFERIQQRQERWVDSLAALYPTSFAIRMAKTYQTPFISASLTKDDRINFLKAHFFDRIDFNDTALLRSKLFVNKAISYLSLYSNNRLTQKQLETEFIKAVTVMLGAASVNPTVYKFWLDYLVGGFDKYHFDEVITYIADNFSDPSSCEDQDRKSTLQKKLDNFKKLAIGKTAPDQEAIDENGVKFKVSDYRGKVVVLDFWGFW